jgi:membrane protein
VLFFVLGGTTMMKHLFLTYLGDLWGGMASMNVSLPSPLMLVVVIVTLLWVAVYEVEQVLKN